MKRQASPQMWIGGTAVLAVLILVAAWFLVIEPVTARAAEDAVQAESQRQQNDLLVSEIEQLKVQSTHLDEYKAELAALRLQMPVTGDGASISRELQSLAEAAGVTITAVAPSMPQAYVPAVDPAATVAGDATAPAESDGTADAGTDGAVDDAVAAVALPGFYTIPLTLTSVGSYDATVAFLRSVQVDASRLYLVSSINAVTQDAAGAVGGRPATNAGDIELTMTGSAYVLTDGALPTVDGGEELPLPVPGGQVNPFQPGR